MGFAQGVAQATLTVVVGDLQALLMTMEMNRGYGGSRVCHDSQIEAQTAVFTSGWEPVRCHGWPTVPAKTRLQVLSKQLICLSAICHMDVIHTGTHTYMRTHTHTYTQQTQHTYTRISPYLIF